MLFLLVRFKFTVKLILFVSSLESHIIIQPTCTSSISMYIDSCSIIIMYLNQFFCLGFSFIFILHGQLKWHFLFDRMNLSSQFFFIFLSFCSINVFESLECYLNDTPIASFQLVHSINIYTYVYTLDQNNIYKWNNENISNKILFKYPYYILFIEFNALMYLYKV